MRKPCEKGVGWDMSVVGDYEKIVGAVGFFSLFREATAVKDNGHEFLAVDLLEKPDIGRNGVLCDFRRRQGLAQPVGPRTAGVTSRY